MQADAVIIGAGIAGSCLAAALAARGYRVVLVERRQGLHHKVCGEFLSPEAQTSLHRLGLHTAVAALEPAAITRALLVSRRGVSLPLALPGVAWGVSRRALDAALATAAERAGATVSEGVTATAVTGDGAGYRVELRDAAGACSTMAARTVVGAYGRHSLPGLRPRQHGAVPKHTHVGVKCHYQGLALPPEVRLYLFEGGYIGLSPIEGGLANLCLLTTRAAFQRAGQRIDGMLAAAIGGNRMLARDLANGEMVPGSAVAVAPVDTHRAPVLWDQYARIGDAATMIPPLCGDGMAMAIRAAEICVPLADDALRGRGTLAGWQAAYHAAWHGEFDGPLRTGRRLQALLALPWASAGLLGLGRLLPGAAQRLVLATRGSGQHSAEL